MRIPGQQSKQRQERELQEAQKALRREIAEHEQEKAERQELLLRLLTAQEAERQHIARELHDQSGQYLAALLLDVKLLENALARDGATPDPAAQEHLERVRRSAQELASALHAVTANLRPAPLATVGVCVSLTNYAEDWSLRTGVGTDFHSVGVLSQRLPPAVETTIYRIVVEALTNVLRHAQATEVNIVIERRADQVAVTVEDNGAGFDPEAVLSATRRLGLVGMRERAALLGGTLDIESSPGAGTTLFLRLPVDEARPLQ